MHGWILTKLGRNHPQGLGIATCVSIPKVQSYSLIILATIFDQTKFNAIKQNMILLVQEVCSKNEVPLYML